MDRFGLPLINTGSVPHSHGQKPILATSLSIDSANPITQEDLERIVSSSSLTSYQSVYEPRPLAGVSTNVPPGSIPTTPTASRRDNAGSSMDFHPLSLDGSPRTPSPTKLPLPLPFSSMHTPNQPSLTLPSSVLPLPGLYVNVNPNPNAPAPFQSPQTPVLDLSKLAAFGARLIDPSEAPQIFGTASAASVVGSTPSPSHAHEAQLQNVNNYLIDSSVQDAADTNTVGIHWDRSETRLSTVSIAPNWVQSDHSSAVSPAAGFLSPTSSTRLKMRTSRRSIYGLPEELWNIIFQFTDFADKLLHMSLVNKTWLGLVMQPDSWFGISQSLRFQTINQFADTMPEIFSALRYFNTTGFSASGVQPEALLAFVIPRCPLLESITLEMGSISEAILAKASKSLTNLSQLSLIFCTVPEQALSAFVCSIPLQTIQISYPSSSCDTLFQALCTIPTLTSVSVMSSKEVSTATLSVLFSGCRQLSHLLVPGNPNVLDSCLLALPETSALQTISLSRCSKITTAGIIHLLTACRGTLSSLDVQSTAFSDACLPYLLQCRRLINLNLSRTAVTDSTVTALPTFRRLRTLNLSYCSKVTPQSVSALWTCLRLHDVDLQGLTINESAMSSASSARLTRLVLDEVPTENMLLDVLRCRTLQVLSIGKLGLDSIAPSSHASSDIETALQSLRGLRYVSILKGAVSISTTLAFFACRAMRVLELPTIPLTEKQTIGLRNQHPRLERLNVYINGKFFSWTKMVGGVWKDTPE